MHDFAIHTPHYFLTHNPEIKSATTKVPKKIVSAGEGRRKRKRKAAETDADEDDEGGSR
jgi:hypothetical protein